jgi:hypothetical protein
MVFTETELNDASGIKEYTHEPSRIETIQAAYNNFVAVSQSNSKDKHYKEVMEATSKEWTSKDPDNADLYKRVSNYDVRDIDKLEALYETNPEMVEGFIQTNPFNADIFLTQDFLKMKELQKNQGLKNFNDINEEILVKANTEYAETNKVLEESDYWGMEMIGTAGGALTDIKTLQTFPLGTWKAGGTIIQNASRAAFEEMGIETLAQSSIAPEVYSFKKELGIKTSILSEATTAVSSIATAGLFRGTSSAAFDLTSSGIKALKIKDPELGEDYERLVSTQVTEDASSHVENLHKTEFGTEVTEIKNPNTKGRELNNAPDVPEHNPEVVANAQAKVISEVDDFEIKPRKDIDEDFQEFHGTTQTLEELRVRDKETTGDFGSGFYTTSSIKDAKTFTMLGDSKNVRVYGVTSTKEIKGLNIDTELASKSNLFPFDTENMTIKEAIQRLRYEEGFSKYDADMIVEELQDFYLNKGFEKWHYSNIIGKGKEKHTVYFEPQKLKVTELKPRLKKELKLYTGTDEAGEAIYKSAKELRDEVDIEADHLRSVEKCLLK